MTRWFWRLYPPIAVATLTLTWFGASIEARVAPVRANQSVSAIWRDQSRLCWTSQTDKLRAGVSDNVDVWLDRADGDMSFPEIYDESTGRGWHKNGVLAPGIGIIRRYCIHLTPDIGPREPLRLRVTAHYRGWLGLWTLMVPLPDVESRSALP